VGFSLAWRFPAMPASSSSCRVWGVRAPLLLLLPLISSGGGPGALDAAWPKRSGESFTRSAYVASWHVNDGLEPIPSGKLLL
jgi:hypothetical protein